LDRHFAGAQCRCFGEVLRESNEVVRRYLFVGFTDCEVHPHLASRAQFGKKRCTNEGMGESPAARTRFVHQPRGDRLVERVQATVIAARHAGKHVKPKVTADYRGPGQHVVRRFPEARQSSSNYLANSVGDRHLFYRSGWHPAGSVVNQRASLRKVTQHLADEKWIALGLGVYRDSELVPFLVEIMLVHRGHNLFDPDKFEAAQRDPLDVGYAPQVREQFA
jgi:hypothetical protein